MPSSGPPNPSQAQRNDDAANNAGFRNVVRLGYVSLFTDFSTEMILSILPVFIHDQLGASYAIVGLIEGSAESMNDFFRIISGVVTDRIAKRKPLVLLGYALSSFAKPLFVFTTTWGEAFIVRVTDRIGKGVRTSPRDAIISDSVTKSQSGKAFGIHSSLDQVGAVVGPLVAFFAFPFIGFKGVFWLSFIPALISLIILLFFVTETIGLTKQRHFFENASEVLNRRFVLLLAAMGVFCIGAYNFSFILLKATTLGVPAASVMLVYVMINASTVVFAYYFGILADRIGKLQVLLLSYVAFFATSVTGIVLTGNWVYAYILAFIFGVYLGISDTVQRAVIPDYARKDLKGTAYAFYYVLIGICAFIANSVFGYLWTVESSTAAFEFTLVTSVAGAIALLLFVKFGARIGTGQYGNS
ncbi:MAG TPA: MFS transporter [Terriglobales bacterium]|nr:MFS transporter [Terriglobales bacterium]